MRRLGGIFSWFALLFVLLTFWAEFATCEPDEAEGRSAGLAELLGGLLTPEAAHHTAQTHSNTAPAKTKEETVKKETTKEKETEKTKKTHISGSKKHDHNQEIIVVMDDSKSHSISDKKMQALVGEALKKEKKVKSHAGKKKKTKSGKKTQQGHKKTKGHSHGKKTHKGSKH